MCSQKTAVAYDVLGPLLAWLDCFKNENPHILASEKCHLKFSSVHYAVSLCNGLPLHSCKYNSIQFIVDDPEKDKLEQIVVNCSLEKKYLIVPK